MHEMIQTELEINLSASATEYLTGIMFSEIEFLLEIQWAQRLPLRP